MCSDFTPGQVEEADKVQKEVIADMFSSFPKAKFGLEVGAGIGRLSSCFSAQVESLIEMDLSRNMLHRIGKETRIHRLVADSGNLPFTSGNFDYVFIANVLGHINNDREILQTAQEISRVMKPGSVLFVDEMTGAEGELVAGHYKIRSPERIAELFTGWKLKHQVSYDFGPQPHSAAIYIGN